MSLFTDVQLLIDETGSGPLFWSNQPPWIYNAINIALEEAWTYIRGWQLTSVPFALSSGSDIVTWDTTNIMIPQYVIDDLQNKVFVTRHDQLQDWVTNWRNTIPAKPHWIVKWDSSHLRVFPTSDASYTYTLFGVPWPPEISATNPDTPLDPQIREAIIHRAAARLLEFTQPELADAYEAQAAEHEKRFFRQVRNGMGDNTLRLAPMKGWQVAQLGDIRVARKYN